MYFTVHILSSTKILQPTPKPPLLLLVGGSGASLRVLVFAAELGREDLDTVM